MHPVIDHVGSWEQRRYGAELLTSNQSESFNATLKKLQQWKEAPVDAMVVVMYRFAQVYENEIARGRAGLGDYELLPGASPVVCSTSTDSTFHDIVERIRSAPRNQPLPSNITPQQPAITDTAATIVAITAATTVADTAAASVVTPAMTIPAGVLRTNGQRQSYHQES